MKHKEETPSERFEDDTRGYRQRVFFLSLMWEGNLCGGGGVGTLFFFLSLSPFLLSVRLSAKIWEMTGAEKDIIAFPVFSGQFRGEKQEP